MSNKVTNIYIDTTGFCNEAIERVNTALDEIVDHNAIEDTYPSSVSVLGDLLAVCFDQYGNWWRTFSTSANLAGKRAIGLWELESIAFRCKQEQKEEPLPTRNIYIDASKLDQEQRLGAFHAIENIADGSMTEWLPVRLADSGIHHEALILFDIFAIDSDGDRRFYSEEYSQDVENRLLGVKELTYDQLMSLTR